MKPKIKYIDYGIGFTVSDKGKNLYIELNKNLKKYPKLKKQVLAHELLHWNSKSWRDDFKIDFYDIINFKKQKEITRFCLNHPKAFLCDSPIFFKNGEIVPNWFTVFFYTSLLIAIIMGVILT